MLPDAHKALIKDQVPICLSEANIRLEALPWVETLSWKNSCHIGFLTILLLLSTARYFTASRRRLLSSLRTVLSLSGLCPGKQDRRPSTTAGPHPRSARTAVRLIPPGSMARVPGVLPTRVSGRSIRACYLIHTIWIGFTTRRVKCPPLGGAALSDRGR